MNASRLVESHFADAAGYWSAIYNLGDVLSVIYQDRRDAVLARVHSLGLAPDSTVLDIGCGGGALAAALASRYVVDAADSVPKMLEAARQRAREAGVADRVRTRLADAHRLNDPDASFDAVTAIGVLPWLRDWTAPLNEFARVLKPGGYLIATIDNAWALNRVLDPSLNPMVQPFKRFLRSALERTGLIQSRARAYFSTAGVLKRELASRGFATFHLDTVGFGPFTVCGFEVLPSSAGVHIHRRLQRAAGSSHGLLPRMGAHCILSARKQL